MITDLGMLYRSVSIKDVQTILGEDSNNLHDLCTSDSINKWAWYKPIRYSSVKVINEENRRTAKYGLFYTENTAAEDLLLASTKTEEAFNAAAESSEWSYLKPQGGTNSPYRLSDFVLEEQDGGTGALIGYKHDTKPPFEIIKDTWEVSYAELSNVANTYFVENDSFSQYDWSIKIYSSATGSTIGAGKLFYGYKMKYDSSSLYDINGPDSLAIPMKSLFGSSDNIDGLDNYWRIGMIVYVPRPDNPFVGLFVSQKTLYSVKTGVNGSNVLYLSVDMCTNQELAYTMKLYIDSINENECIFRALPVLVENATIGYEPALGPLPDNFSGQSWHGQSKITTGNNIKIYPLPTGSTEIRIKVNKEDESTEPPRTYGDFELAVIPISTADPYVNVCTIAIISGNTIGETKSAEVYVDYVILDIVNGLEVERTHTLNATYTIQLGAHFDNTYNSTTYNGIDLRQLNPSIIPGRKLYISKVRKFIVT